MNLALDMQVMNPCEYFRNATNSAWTSPHPILVRSLYGEKRSLVGAGLLSEFLFAAACKPLQTQYVHLPPWISETCASWKSQALSSMLYKHYSKPPPSQESRNHIPNSATHTPMPLHRSRTWWNHVWRRRVSPRRRFILSIVSSSSVSLGWEHSNL